MVYEWISIHVPRVEDDEDCRDYSKEFSYFNPRPPCGGRPKKRETQTEQKHISIHVPRVEDDYFMDYSLLL